MIYDNEIVRDPSTAKNREEFQKILYENEIAKQRHSLRREQERLDSPNIIEKIIIEIHKLKLKLNKTEQNVH